MELPQHIQKYDILISSYRASVTVLYSKKYRVSEIYKALYKSHPRLNWDDNEDDAVNDEGDGALTVVIHDAREIYVIFDKDVDISYLHHECIHIVTFLFSLIQTKHTEETDEVFAYLSQSIFSDIYNALINTFKVKKSSFLKVDR